MTSPKLKFFGLGMLKEHEFPEPSLTKHLLEEIRADGVLRRPIAVDENTNVILDGHSRFTCLNLLGCKIIPLTSSIIECPKSSYALTEEERELLKIT